LIKGKFVSLSLNQFSSHVICVALKHIKDFTAIIEEVKPALRTVSCHQHGVQVIKMLIQNRAIDVMLLPSLVELSQDAYGNFAVQHLIEYYDKHVISSIIQP
jgi:hypothetical protein